MCLHLKLGVKNPTFLFPEEQNVRCRFLLKRFRVFALRMAKYA